VRAEFWKHKRLDELGADEWEALCDGCAQCCVVKLQDEDTGDIAVTNIACRLLDCESCRCSDYRHRHEQVAACAAFSVTEVAEFHWLPPTCAYRLLAEGKPLADWHPLVSGDPDSVHAAGISVRGTVVSESAVPEDDVEDYIVRWIEPL
jgi:uncharacterized cysteine cluster protein YcgN (CxxCxxCC family)